MKWPMKAVMSADAIHCRHASFRVSINLGMYPVDIRHPIKVEPGPHIRPNRK